MVRSKKLLISSLRNGVMVINIEDGGSVSFYKVWSGTAWNTLKRRASNDGPVANNNIASTPSRVSSTSSLLKLYDETRVDSVEKRSIFLRQVKSRRNIMEVDKETKAKMEKVTIYVSRSTFREPMEMPFLSIPAVSSCCPCHVTCPEYLIGQLMLAMFIYCCCSWHDMHNNT